VNLSRKKGRKGPEKVRESEGGGGGGGEESEKQEQSRECKLA